MQTPAIYRPWPTIILAGIGLTADVGFLAVQIYAAATGGGTWSSVRLALPAVLVGLWLGWMMTNRLILTTDRLSSRYLWQDHTISRSDIDHVHDVRPLGGATSVALVLKDERVVALTWSGRAADALVDWLRDVPARTPGAGITSPGSEGDAAG